MDLSKLPKLSGPPRPTDADAPVVATPVDAPPPVAHRAPPAQAEGVGPDALISIGIGVILILLNRRLLTALLGDMPIYTMPEGTPVHYLDTNDFWSDLAITAFAAALVAEGVVIAFVRNAWVVLAVLAFTVAATAGNLVYLVATYRSQGLAILSAFAVLFGTYIAWYEWRLFKRLREGI